MKGEHMITDAIVYIFRGVGRSSTKDTDLAMQSVVLLVVRCVMTYLIRAVLLVQRLL